MTATPETDPTDFALNEYERRMASTHATAWQGMADDMAELRKSEHMGGAVIRSTALALNMQASSLAAQYRRIADSGKAGM